MTDEMSDGRMAAFLSFGEKDGRSEQSSCVKH